MSLIQPEHKSTKGSMERIKTGIEGLDELISGGIPKSTITLVSGPPGSGKTILCCQFLYQGVQEGKKCLFLTLDKKVEGLLIQASELGLDFQPAIDKGQIKFLHLNINKKLVYESMINEILSGEYDRVVLDSITPLSEMPIYISDIETQKDFSIINSNEISPEKGFPIRRLHLHYIMDALDTAKSTSMVTSPTSGRKFSTTTTTWSRTTDSTGPATRSTRPYRCGSCRPCSTRPSAWCSRATTGPASTSGWPCPP